MKTRHFFTLLLAIGLTISNSFAQEGDSSNPYAIFGGDPYIAGGRLNGARTRTFVIENVAEGLRVARLEHDTETGVVRSYDSEGNLIEVRTLRRGERAWPTMDRFAEKYYSTSPYAYVANNPVSYTDPTGDTINVEAILSYDQVYETNYMNKIIEDLNSQTGLTFSVNSSGIMTYSVDAQGNPVIATDANGNAVGSATARNLMMGAVGHADTAHGSIVVDGRSGSRGGGNLLEISPAQVGDFIAGASGVDRRTLGYGMTFMHEIYHTNVGGGLRDAPYSAGNPGPVVTRMNDIRGELNAQGGNYGQRMSYPSTAVYGSVAIIPFSAGASTALQNGYSVRGTPHVMHRIIHPR
jgi:hypothetical protein